MSNNIDSIIANFTRQLASELANLSAVELAALANGHAPSKRGRKPGASSVARSSPASFVSVDDIAGVVQKATEGPLTSDEIAEMLSVNRSDIAKALKEAVAQGKVAQHGKARGTKYGMVGEITAPAAVAPEAPTFQKRKKAK